MVTSLPIVERELRVRARFKSTHRLRWIAAAGVIAIWLFMMFVSGHTTPHERAKIVFIAISIVMIVRPGALSRLTITGATAKPVGRILGITMLLFSIAWTALATTGIMRSRAIYGAASRDGTCTSVEGVVTGFRMPKDTHFSVSGVAFEYSSSEITAGFNDEGWFSSPVKDGMHVRICYVAPGGILGKVIVRLEIADQR